MKHKFRCAKLKSGILDLIGQKIRFNRKKAGLNQKALAQKSGLSTQTISKYELGQVTQSPQNIFIIAQVLKVEVSALYPDASSFQALLSRSKVSRSEPQALCAGSPQTQSPGPSDARAVA